MSVVATIGLDLAKQVFQAHGADANGNTLFNRKLRRDELLAFFKKLPPCLVAMEACGSSTYWAREIGSLGHSVRIIPAQRVKPFVVRGKTDAADAVAITTALKQENMHFVPVKTTAQQAWAMLIRTRTFLVRQRGNAVNALRGHMAEFGLVTETSKTSISKLIATLSTASSDGIPATARFALGHILAEIEFLSERIEAINAKINSNAKEDDQVKRLTTIPGIGPLIASTITAYVPDLSSFKTGRNFAAWLGLTPKQNSSGGKTKLGRISRMGNSELRSLLYIGAMSVLVAARRYGRATLWLQRLLARRPFKVATVALANKMARVIWAILTKGTTFQANAWSASP
jgi:transposase